MKAAEEPSDPVTEALALLQVETLSLLQGELNSCLGKDYIWLNCLNGKVELATPSYSDIMDQLLVSMVLITMLLVEVIQRYFLSPQQLFTTTRPNGY